MQSTLLAPYPLLQAAHDPLQPTPFNNILVLRTDLKTRKKVKALAPMLNHHPNVLSWSVDIEDIDNVLRIEATGALDEASVIRLLQSYGYYCAALPD